MLNKLKSKFQKWMKNSYNAKESKSKINLDNLINIFFIIILIVFIGIKILSNNVFNKEIIETKEMNEVNKNHFAMYIDEGVGYKEYDSDFFPSNYRLNYENSKCEDKSGQEIDNIWEKIIQKDNKITLKSDITIYCSLYFDYIGTGEEESPYRIGFIEDLVELAQNVNDGETYEQAYFELRSDLDFRDENDYRNYKTSQYGDINDDGQDEELLTELTTGSGWDAIGSTKDNSFKGNFDGKDYTISNLYINNSTEANRVGLFGYVSGANIKNLTISGSITSVTSEVGTFAGQIENTTMENLTNNATVKISSTSSTESAAGGIVGAAFSNATLRNCKNNGSVEGSNGAGGIIGLNSANTQLLIENCTNNAIITNNVGTFSAGILGSDVATSTTKINNCVNNNSVNLTTSGTNSWAGGIVARILGTSIIDRSINHGSVSNNGISGGIIGLNGKDTYVLNSYNDGTITAGTESGGILGYSQLNAYIINSYNRGNTVGTTYAAGILGVAALSQNSTKVVISNTYNTGNIEATNKYGVIYSSSATNTISYAYYKSGISGSNQTGTTVMEEGNMKVANFVNTLNNNKIAVDLNGISTNLKNYALCGWKLGESGYPELDCTHVYYIPTIRTCTQYVNCTKAATSTTACDSGDTYNLYSPSQSEYQNKCWHDSKKTSSTYSGCASYFDGGKTCNYCVNKGTNYRCYNVYAKKTKYSCSQGTLSSKTCTLSNQLTCPSGWTTNNTSTKVAFIDSNGVVTSQCKVETAPSCASTTDAGKSYVSACKPV